MQNYIDYVGNLFYDNKDFVIMLCKPTAQQQIALEPFLATWPNTFNAIVSDFAGPARDCSLAMNEGETTICKLALQYRDVKSTIYASDLAKTFNLAVQLFNTINSTAALSRDYGIYPAHSGLGFVVKDSVTSTGNTVNMTTAEILRNSIVPEYLFKNAYLKDANCRCLQVPSSSKFEASPIDPKFIWETGTLDKEGSCKRVKELSRQKAHHKK